MSRSLYGHLVSSGCQPGSARQDLYGLPGRSEVGAAPQKPPSGAAPNLVGAAIFPSLRTGASSARVVATAALTLFEGQAAFRVIIGTDTSPAPLFRFRRGCRTHLFTDGRP